MKGNCDRCGGFRALQEGTTLIQDPATHNQLGYLRYLIAEQPESETAQYALSVLNEAPETITKGQASFTIQELLKTRPSPSRRPTAGLLNFATRLPKRGTFTVVGSREHRTICFKAGSGKLDGKTVISFRNGPEYTWFAHLDGQKVIIWRQFSDRTDLIASLKFLASSKEKQEAAGKAYAVESGQCYLCGKQLTDPKSIRLGIGPVCRKERAA